MNIVLYYDFIDERWHEGSDSVFVRKHNFPFIVKVDDNECFSPEKLGQLKEKYREQALEAAAYKTMCEYADFAYKCC